MLLEEGVCYDQCIFLAIEKAREFQKNIYFCFIDYAKAFDCVDHNKLRKILKEMGIPDHLSFKTVFYKHSVETQPEAAVYEPEYGQSGLDLGLPSPRTGEQHIYTVCKSPSLWQFVRATLGD